MSFCRTYDGYIAKMFIATKGKYSLNDTRNIAIAELDQFCSSRGFNGMKKYLMFDETEYIRLRSVKDFESSHYNYLSSGRKIKYIHAKWEAECDAGILGINFLGYTKVNQMLSGVPYCENLLKREQVNFDYVGDELFFGGIDSDQIKQEAYLELNKICAEKHSGFARLDSIHFSYNQRKCQNKKEGRVFCPGVFAEGLCLDKSE